MFSGSTLLTFPTRHAKGRRKASETPQNYLGEDPGILSQIHVSQNLGFIVDKDLQSEVLSAPCHRHGFVNSRIRMPEKGVLRETHVLNLSDQAKWVGVLIAPGSWAP